MNLFYSPPWKTILYRSLTASLIRIDYQTYPIKKPLEIGLASIFKLCNYCNGCNQIFLGNKSALLSFIFNGLPELIPFIPRSEYVLVYGMFLNI